MRTVVALVCVCVAPSVAHARKHPRFEPTDLELEDPGTTELDLQLGAVKGPDTSRIVVPDFELDLSILPNVELDLDGAYAVERGPHSAPDNLWLSVKLGLFDQRDASGDAWAGGIQVGPKLPTATGTRGVGVEGLALLGRMMGPVHLVGQIGALVDPEVEATRSRPYGVEGGLDLELVLKKDTWSLLGELGGIWYGSTDDNQLAATAGIQYSPTASVDLSVVAMVGFLDGSDPYGVLLGVSPKLALW